MDRVARQVFVHSSGFFRALKYGYGIRCVLSPIIRIRTIINWIHNTGYICGIAQSANHSKGPDFSTRNTPALEDRRKRLVLPRV